MNYLREYTELLNEGKTSEFNVEKFSKLVHAYYSTFVALYAAVDNRADNATILRLEKRHDKTYHDLVGKYGEQVGSENKKLSSYVLDLRDGRITPNQLIQMFLPSRRYGTDVDEFIWHALMSAKRDYLKQLEMQNANAEFVDLASARFDKFLYKSGLSRVSVNPRK